MIHVIYTTPEKDGPPFRFKVYQGDGGYKKILPGVALGGGKFEYYVPDCAANRQLLATANKKIFSFSLNGEASSGPSTKEQELEKELAELKAKLGTPNPDDGIPKRVIKRPEIIILLKKNEIEYDFKAKNIDLFGLLPNELTTNLQPS